MKRFPQAAVSNGWKILLLGFPIIGTALLFGCVAQAQFVPPTQAVYAVMVDASGSLVAPTNAQVGNRFSPTNNLSMGGFGFLNVGFLGSTNPLPDAFVTSDGGTNHKYVYGPRDLLTSTEINNLRTADTNLVLYPGQLVRALQGSAAGSIYISTDAINFAEYNGTNVNWMPGMVDDRYWRLFLAKPSDGSTGAQGIPGLDGTGYSYHGDWSELREYVHDTNAWITVDYAGRIYRTVATSSNVQPTAIGATSSWAIAVDRGESGTITVLSNFVVRGQWDSGVTYTTNDYVSYNGNEFVVWETNVAPAVGVAPGLNSDQIGTNTPYWTLWKARGLRGASGVATSTIYQTFSSSEYRLFDDEFTIFNNLPSDTNNVIVWLSESGGTNYYTFAGYLPAGTNKITVGQGSNIYVNGVLFNSGGVGTVTNAISTNDYLTARVVDGQVEIGSTSTPIFAETDAAGIAASQSANATSLYGRAAATNTPNDGSAIVWNATLGRMEFSDAPPASSTNAVNSVNSGVGLVTIVGGNGVDVSTSGATNPVITLSAMSAYEYIGGYTYTGLEASVTLTWTQHYDLIKVLLSGDLIGNDNGANGCWWSVQLNNQVGLGRALFRNDANVDTAPATPFSFNAFTNAIGLHQIAFSNDANPFAYQRTFHAGEWDFVNAPRGVHVRGSGLGWFNGADIVYEMTGSWRAPAFDSVTRNAITQMSFAAYMITNGSSMATRSNAVLKIFGVRGQ